MLRGAAIQPRPWAGALPRRGALWAPQWGGVQRGVGAVSAVEGLWAAAYGSSLLGDVRTAPPPPARQCAAPRAPWEAFSSASALLKEEKRDVQKQPEQREGDKGQKEEAGADVAQEQPSKAVQPTPKAVAPWEQQLEELGGLVVSKWDVAKAKLRSMPGHIMEELRHYWSGTKLLVFEVRTCASLVLKLMRGKSLTRREKNQLKRTFADLLRLVPFAFFLIVPFMELLLPVALKLFPNMLPSTYQTASQVELKREKELKAKIEVAKFLQEAVAERAASVLEHDEDLGQEFEEFVESLRSGSPISNAQLIKFAKLFKDRYTLDNIPHGQLVLMCKFLQMPAFGTTPFLRYILRQKLAEIKRDDKEIQREGLSALTIGELRAACIARGLPAAPNRSRVFMEDRLEEWLDLSLNQNLPIGLLIYANAMKLTSSISASDALREALYGLNEEMMKQIRLRVASGSGTLTDAEAEKLRLELLRRENERIAEENAQEDSTQTLIEANQMQQWIMQHKDIARGSVKFSAKQLREVMDAVHQMIDDSLLEEERSSLQKLKTVLDKRRSELKEKETDASEDFKEREEEALEESFRDVMSVLEEKGEDMTLLQSATKEELKTILLEDIEEKKEREQAVKDFLKRTQRISSLEERLSSFVDSIGSELNQVQEERKLRLGIELLEQDPAALQQPPSEAEASPSSSSPGDGAAAEGAAAAEQEAEEGVDRPLDEDNDGVVSVDELKSRLIFLLQKKALRGSVNAAAVDHVVSKLDLDHDGKITLQELLLLTDTKFVEDHEDVDQDDDDDAAAEESAPPLPEETSQGNGRASSDGPSKEEVSFESLDPDQQQKKPH